MDGGTNNVIREVRIPYLRRFGNYIY